MTFYFYDLETSGFDPRFARIMQFAGQRTTADLQPIGNPHNFLIIQTPDILPSPEAVMVTGITPQHTWADGLSEPDFLDIFHQEVATPNTMFVGFNTVRFDDEFMRYTHYRNFYDPYEWQWKEGRSRWDLLDVIRMTRALRPDGIAWPVDNNNRPTNRLELLTKANKLEHADAHDALADVMATIDIAKMLLSKQPKLFQYLLKMRTKSSIEEFIGRGKPFVYCSGRYDNQYEKTTIVASLGKHPERQGVLVYDLRYDPQSFFGLGANQLAELWQSKIDSGEMALPIKTLQFNRCPAVAPLAVIDKATEKRLDIDMDLVKKHFSILLQNNDWSEELFKALRIVEDSRQQKFGIQDQPVDTRLYDGFYPTADKALLPKIRQSSADKLMEFTQKVQDQRLAELLFLYKARNYPKSLSEEESNRWEDYRRQKLFEGGEESEIAKYFARIEELSKDKNLTTGQSHLLQDLVLYGQSLLPFSH